MLMKPQFFYDHTTKQALGFQNPFYLKKAQQLEPKLYDGIAIKNTNPTLLESLGGGPTKVKVPKELPKVSMVNTSLKKLKHHLAGFDVVLNLQEKDTVIKKLKERIKSLSGKMNEDKIKKDLEEIETINIELDHRSVEISDLNAHLQENVLEITDLKDELRKLKGKALVDNVVTKHTIDPEMFKNDEDPITPKIPTGRTFTIVGNACNLTRITTTTEVPLRKPTALNNETPKPVVTLVYSWKPRKSKSNVSVSKSKVLKSVSANKKEPSQSWGSISFSDVPSPSLDESGHPQMFPGLEFFFGCSKHMTEDRSQLTNFVNKFLGTVKFGNDYVAKILGYGDY
ncbi:hypothetical protein Tco_1055458 [Tanacetum coccineum]|uniref:Integrase, catalytic region, zinc finger, CCHC-type, peptidase aspartic, catalytic n=1 Tax=Tanacetum coccineum TaxID=301880 RepID=A0ABQ5H0W7_9ASTR